MTASPVAASSADAFDALSPRYDAIFSATSNPLVGLMRARVYAAVARHFPVGATLLELGCGTGEDTLALAARGYRLVACDPAPGMLVRANNKITAAGHTDVVRFVPGAVTDVAAAWSTLAAGGVTIDGAFSNFAPLNCELSLAPLRSLLERALPPGGRFIGVVLPRLCPLEVAFFLARGQPRAALRRFKLRPVGHVDGRTFPMRYYGAAAFDRALGGGFRRVETRSLGLCLPPLTFGPDMARAPRLLAALTVLEDRLAGLPGLRRMGDHVLLAYERLPPEWTATAGW